MAVVTAVPSQGWCTDMTYIPPRRSEGTIQQARLKQPWPKDQLFRILSIDGGGIRGVFPAAYLAEIEHRFLAGRSIASCFDMVAGTSTGGIIALALAHGLTAREALQVYVDRGPRIFPSLTGWRKWRRALRWVSHPKHDQSVLRDELLSVFGEKLLNDAKTRIVIPSFEGLHGEPFLYKTPHHPDYQKDRHQKFAHVALHTSAAPAYYPAVYNDGHFMVDGGIWANNPVMNALVDVLACYDVPRENIRILSLGTGEEEFSITAGPRSGGIGHWAFLRAFKAAARAQSKNALGQAFLLIGKNNVLRIDPPESAKPIDLDDTSRALRELPAVAKSFAESSGHYVAAMFLNDIASPFIGYPYSPDPVVPIGENIP